MIDLQTEAKDFALIDTVSGNIVSRSDFLGSILVVMFISNHCPYVKKIMKAIAKFGEEFENKISIVAIGSNDVDSYPEDSPQEMQRVAKSFHFSFPYLYDETQEVAKAYDAQATPDFYLFDKSHKLSYRGQFDSVRPNDIEESTGKDLKDAVEALLDGRSVKKEQIPSSGCSIKWK
jgi:thiol-disulfide isomerase/thioredoxin